MNYYSKNLNASKLQKCYNIAPPRIQQLLTAEIDFVLRKLSLNDIVLDLGCGYGRVAIELAKKAKKIIGIDISQDNIELAKNLYHPIDNLEFYTMNAVKLNFSAEMFDITICVQNGISAFKEDPYLLLTEALRVTKKEGILLFSSYSNKIWQDRLHWFQIQVDEKLLGEIDYEQTKDGLIVCKDGFKAITYSENDFFKLASEFNVDANIYEVDNSSIFCEIKKK
ncbi:MAG: class I SAM-dependent methyltransferase [Prevotellaceae bacterium]|jgi:2-polyprenyl-6-hydroxyphenyl methylase/3-demethylubiquinone-9 3-methyltransferase|nr:class I SAM-dependent methyltransferase [Prevotellaceae bacterium]